jgi:thymidylate synthase ThyX
MLGDLRASARAFSKTRHWPEILVEIGHPIVYVHPYTIQHSRTKTLFDNQIYRCRLLAIGF